MKPPADLIKPHVRFGITDHDLEIFEAAAQKEVSVLIHDTAGTSDHVESMTRQAQASTLFAGRMLDALIRVGNPIETAHMCLQALFSETPDQAERIALDWAIPDLSMITGETNNDPQPELDPVLERMLKVAQQQFVRAAAAMPVLNSWVQIGLKVGLNSDEVFDAASSILDLDQVFNGLVCQCSECVKYRNKNA
jgi:hypothetical protein